MTRALVLAAALLTASIVPAAARDDGEIVFQRCFACHSVDPAERGLPGPNLHGLLGRRAGTLEDFEFSDAMRGAGARGLVWTAETLDRYLAEPEDFIPEGRMAGVRLRDGEQRRVLIEWLMRATR